MVQLPKVITWLAWAVPSVIAWVAIILYLVGIGLILAAISVALTR